MANASAVINFANSDGCNLNPPISYHEIAPPVLLSVNKTKYYLSLLIKFTKYLCANKAIKKNKIKLINKKIES